MKKYILILALLVSAQAYAQVKDPITRVVLEHEKRWADALLANNTQALEMLYSDQLVYTHSNGVVDDKKKYIENIRSGASAYKSIERDDIKCMVYGKTAIVTSHSLFQVQNKDQSIIANTRMIHVWVKEGKNWKLVAHQTTRL